MERRYRKTLSDGNEQKKKSDDDDGDSGGGDKEEKDTKESEKIMLSNVIIYGAKGILRLLIKQ